MHDQDLAGVTREAVLEDDHIPGPGPDQDNLDPVSPGPDQEGDLVLHQGDESTVQLLADIGAGAELEVIGSLLEEKCPL